MGADDQVIAVVRKTPAAPFLRLRNSERRRIGWTSHPMMASGFDDETAARAWLEERYPGWLAKMADGGMPITFERRSIALARRAV